MTPGVLSPQASGRSLGLLVSEAEQSQASSRSRSSDELTPARASHKTSPGISPPRLAPQLSHPLRGQFFMVFVCPFSKTENNFVNVGIWGCCCKRLCLPLHVACEQESLSDDTAINSIRQQIKLDYFRGYPAKSVNRQIIELEAIGATKINVHNKKDSKEGEKGKNKS